ncbi:enoyl-CoA hydratase/isomerase family protein [Mycobacterium camsae]|uniref:enoyl-CoA hydratase/isomerase family protein n=1 Tax=Mycobacterium gordonae TaxID=1778 RepID=UPI001F1219A0|nr:hypothetical protein [Mycobacterium gordonae]
MILGGADIDAETAEAWGYINRAVPPEQLHTFVARLARRIASSPQPAIAATNVPSTRRPGDLTAGLRIQDQLLRETVARPAARKQLRPIIDAGAQTREFELGSGP